MNKKDYVILVDEENNDMGICKKMELQYILTNLFGFTRQTTLQNGVSEYETDHAFAQNTCVKPTLNPEEAVDWRYVNYQTLKNKIIQSPNKYNVWMKMPAKRLDEKLQIQETEK